MVTNYAKGAILFASIYIIVFLLSASLMASKPALVKANPSVANAVIATPTATKSTSYIGILVLEVIAVSAIAIAEMRYKALSKLYALISNHMKMWHPHIILALQAITIIGLGYLTWIYWGFALFLFIAVNGLGMLFVYRFLLHKANLKKIAPVAITFLSFLILWPFALLAIGNNLILLIFMEFAYFPVAFLVSALVMRNPTKNRMNAVAFSFAVLLPPFIATLFTPVYALLLLVIFSVYDFIAVFWTKHMGFMAQKLIAMNVPEVFMLGDFKLIQKRVAAIGKKKNEAAYEKALKGIDRPLIFGVGDAVLPGVVIAAFALAGHLYFAAFVTGGAIIGIVANLWTLSLKKRILPALPLILICMIFALLLALAI